MKTLIAIPCLDQVPTPFLRSALRLRRVGYALYMERWGQCA